MTTIQPTYMQLKEIKLLHNEIKSLELKYDDLFKKYMKIKKEARAKNIYDDIFELQEVGHEMQNIKYMVLKLNREVTEKEKLYGLKK